MSIMEKQRRLRRFYAIQVALLPMLASLSLVMLTGCGRSRSVMDEEMSVLGPTRALHPPVSVWSLGSNLTPTRSGPVLTWLEPVNPPVSNGKTREQPRPRDSDPWRLCWSRYDGERWSRRRVITQSTRLFVNWADFPSLVETGDGVWLAHWLEKSGPDPYAYDVMVARSTNQGRTWTRLGKIHDDFTQSEHGFLSFVSADDGAWAFWLDGRAMGGGHSDESEDGHGGGGDMSLRAAHVNDEVSHRAALDLRVCECCGTSGAMTSYGPLIVYRDRGEQEHRDIWIVRKRGDRWTEPAPIHVDGWEIFGCPVNGPAVDASGQLVAVAWFTAADSKARVLAAFSGNGGESFGPPILVDQEESGRAPAGRVDLLLDSRTGGAIVSWLDDDEEHGAAIRLAHVSGTGDVGPHITVAATDEARSSGFPRLVREGQMLLFTWTDPETPWVVRVGRVPVGAIPLPEYSARLETILGERR